jgi:hypothetical protein
VDNSPRRNDVLRSEVGRIRPEPERIQESGLREKTTRCWVRAYDS